MSSRRFVSARPGSKDTNSGKLRPLVLLLISWVLATPGAADPGGADAVTQSAQNDESADAILVSAYSNCLPDLARAKYPVYDPATDRIVSLQDAINRCRLAAGHTALAPTDQDLLSIEAAIARLAKGSPLMLTAPEAGSPAEKWYMLGKFLFHARRGQQNIACTQCHVQQAGGRYFDQELSPAASHALKFPVYRSSDQQWRSLHQQYAICSERVGARPFKAGSNEFKAIEYYQSIQSNGGLLDAPVHEH